MPTRGPLGVWEPPERLAMVRPTRLGELAALAGGAAKLFLLGIGWA